MENEPKSIQPSQSMSLADLVQAEKQGLDINKLLFHKYLVDTGRYIADTGAINEVSRESSDSENVAESSPLLTDSAAEITTDAQADRYPAISMPRVILKKDVPRLAHAIDSNVKANSNATPTQREAFELWWQTEWHPNHSIAEEGMDNDREITLFQAKSAQPTTATIVTSEQELVNRGFSPEQIETLNNISQAHYGTSSTASEPQAVEETTRRVFEPLSPEEQHEAEELQRSWDDACKTTKILEILMVDGLSEEKVKERLLFQRWRAQHTDQGTSEQQSTDENPVNS